MNKLPSLNRTIPLMVAIVAVLGAFFCCPIAGLAKPTKKLGIPAAAAFSGLSGYRRVLDAKPDAIVIESTPYFHPEQAMAGVEAGCHV